MKKDEPLDVATDRRDIADARERRRRERCGEVAQTLRDYVEREFGERLGYSTRRGRSRDTGPITIKNPPQGSGYFNNRICKEV